MAALIDSYYGLWAPWEEGEGGMWGIYTAKTRADIAQKDPKGLAILEKFLPDHITYMARIAPEFNGTFQLSFDPKLPYTHKSQYLTDAWLLGNKPSNLVGNARDNVLIGNIADNILDGGAGRDVVQYELDVAEVLITPDLETGDWIVESEFFGRDTLKNIELIRFFDEDISLE